MNLKFRTFALSALAVTALTATSCIDRSEEKEDVQPANAASISDELAKVWDFDDTKTNPLAMKAGDFALFYNTQQIETMQPLLFLQEGLNVTGHNVFTDPNNAKKDIHELKFAYETVKYASDGTSEQSTREQERYWRTDKPTSTTTPATETESLAQKAAEISVSALQPKSVSPMADEGDTDNDLKMELGFERIAVMPYMCVSSPELTKLCQEQLGAESCTRTCTNLSNEETLEDAPELISKQPNCLGLPGCKLRIKRLKFNSILTVKFKNATQTQKVSYAIAVSPDLPYLARVTEFCARQLISYNSGKFLVNLCSKLGNYRPSPTP